MHRRKKQHKCWALALSPCVSLGGSSLCRKKSVAAALGDGVVACRCYQLTLHTNKNQPAPSKNWCLILKGLVFGTPTPIHLKHALEGPKMASFWKETNNCRYDLEFKRLARKDTRSSREQQKHFPTVWHFWVDDFPNLIVWWDMLTDYWDPPRK